MSINPKSETDKTPEQVPKPPNHPPLLTWDELPHWLQDNHYIRAHYRPPSYSILKSLASIFAIHNETVNIWTHLSGAAMFLLILYILARATPIDVMQLPSGSPLTSTDLIYLSPFFVGAVGCLTISGLFHATSNVSPNVGRLGNQADYAGIVLLIWGSFIPSVHYGFYCHPHLKHIYWTMITLIAAGCMTTTMLSKFRSPMWRPYRAAMFVGMGLSAVVPVCHGLVTAGWAVLEKSMGAGWVILQGALYISGAGLYAARVPERWAPGRFNVLGSAHQIFHVLVVLAAACHLVGLVKAAGYARQLDRCARMP